MLPVPEKQSNSNEEIPKKIPEYIYVAAIAIGIGAFAAIRGAWAEAIYTGIGGLIIAWVLSRSHETASIEEAEQEPPPGSLPQSEVPPTPEPMDGKTT